MLLDRIAAKVKKIAMDPLIRLNDVFDRLGEEYGTTKEEDMFFHYDCNSKLQNLGEVLDRFDMYIWLMEKKLKEVAPDDPLVKDTVNHV